jgi:hypothetical protein
VTTPVPDPTELTTRAVALATDQWRRELQSLRDLVDLRFSGIDTATQLLATSVNKTPTAIETAVTGMREVYDEKFRSISLQFRERDVRTAQASVAADSALKAALQAAKEAVFEQANAAARAAEKTELSFTKQIDQIGLQITTVAKGLDDRIGELKERVDRGEGARMGTAGQRQDSRQSTTLVIYAILGLISLATFILYVTKK